MANTLEYILKLKDEATKELEGFGKSVSTNEDRLKSFQKAAAIAGTALTGMGIAGFSVLKDWAEKASEAEKEMARVNATLSTLNITSGKHKVSFDDLQKTTATLSQSYVKLGFDDEAVSLAFAKSLQITGDVTQSKIALAAATDLARYKDVDLETASQALNKAMMGNTRVLKELGIEVSDNATKQEVLAAVQSRVTGQAEAYTKTYAGQMDILNEKMTNLKEALGEKLLPTLTSFVESLSKMADKLNALSPEQIDAIVKSLTGFTIFALITGPMLTFIAALPLLAQGLTMVSAALAPMMLAAPWLLLVAAIVAAIWYLIANWDIWENNVNAGVTLIQGWLFNLGYTWGDTTTNMGIAWNTFWDNAGKKTNTTTTQISKDFSETTRQLKLNFENTKTGFDTMVTNMGTAWNGFWSNARTTLTSSFNFVTQQIKLMAENAFEWGKNLIKSFGDGIKSMANWLGEQVKAALESAKKMLESHSPPVAGPLKDIDKWGFNMGKTFVDNMREALSENPLRNQTQNTYTQNVNVNAQVNNGMDAYSLATILGQQLAFSGQYD